MELFWNISNLTILGFLISLSLLGTFYKHISFGWGLGDIFGYLILYGTTLVHIILTIFFWQKGISQYEYLAISFLIISVFICLKATIWRGHEYSWNGRIFYLPCPARIAIENQKEVKELLITMCSMDYYSKFTAIWNGKEMENINGEIKIPDKLKKYINYPIQSILIQSYAKNRIDNVSSNGYSNFEEAALRLNNEYILSGEIIKIVDKKPMLKVKIKLPLIRDRPKTAT